MRLRFRYRQGNTKALRFGDGRAKSKDQNRECDEMPDSAPETTSENAGLRHALEAADPATLLLSLVQLTGERHWLEAAKPFIRGLRSRG